MRKTNKLIGIILALAMLLSLMPTAIFAAGTPVARNGETEYDIIDNAFDYDAYKSGDTIELLANATSQYELGLAKSATVKMNGYCITLGRSPFKPSGGNFNIFNSGKRTFDNGTIAGFFQISNGSVILNAPNGAEYAVDGGIKITGGSITISGAKVGLKGTLEASAVVDISGTEKAVELTEEATIPGYEVLGSTDVDTEPTSKADYDEVEKTYKVNGAVAKRIKVVKIVYPEPNPPSLSKDGVPVVTTENDPIKIYAGQSITFDTGYTGMPPLSVDIQKSGHESGIWSEISADKSKITISTRKTVGQTLYPVFVYPDGYIGKSVTV